MNIDEDKLKAVDKTLSIMSETLRRVIYRNASNRVVLEDLGRLYLMAEAICRDVIAVLNSYYSTEFHSKEDTSYISQFNTIRASTSVEPNDIVVIKVFERAPLRKDTYNKNKWLTIMNYAINGLKQKCTTPYFEKAFVLINIHHPLVRTHDNYDCDNVLVQPILNKVKGNFCRDDSRGYMSHMIMSTIDDDCYVQIEICEMEQAPYLINNTLNSKNK